MAVLRHVLACLACLAPLAAHPAAPEGAASIEAVARAAALRATGRPAEDLEIGPLDPRLTRPACAGPLEARPAPGTRGVAQLTIEVRCAEPSWRLYVAARVHAEEPVVVAARPLARLQPIAAEDLMLVTRDLGGLPAGYFRRAEDVVGRIAQRTIGAGEVLQPGSARPPPLVRRGQSVTLLVHGAVLNVRAPGVVLADAGLHERVQVRNRESARVVEGIVQSAETIEVSLE